MTNLKAIGRRVRQLREAAGLGQEELAAEVGTSRSTIAGIETAGDRGGGELMIAIADYFKVPLDWLHCREVPPGGPLVGQFIEDLDELALINFWRGLTPVERSAVAKMLHIRDDRASA
jgi:transcriptional regulator with XRE-family HTH domain